MQAQLPHPELHGWQRFAGRWVQADPASAR
jgi:hypothetical protein